MQEKLDLYCVLGAEKIKARGWAVGRCDGLLFSSLHAVACGYPNILPFEDGGRWYRDPAHECGITGGAGSTISKDMITGLLLWLAVGKRVEATKRFVDYGNANNWKIGTATENEIGTVVMSPGIITLAHDVLNYVTGDNERATIDEPYVRRTGYESHLSIVNVVTKHVINRSLSDNSMSIVQREASRQPANGLYQAVNAMYGGDQNCQSLLLDESKFPKYSLPNTRDNYCTDYLYQRDDDSAGRPDGKAPDWLPCPEREFSEHDGTDFVIAASVMRRRIEMRAWLAVLKAIPTYVKSALKEIKTQCIKKFSK